MMVSLDTILLVGVFVYFAIGALYAGVMTYASLGFTGRPCWLAIPAFFAWPIMWLLATFGPAFIFVGLGIAAAGGMTWLTWLGIRHFTGAA